MLAPRSQAWGTNEVASLASRLEVEQAPSHWPPDIQRSVARLSDRRRLNTSSFDTQADGWRKKVLESQWLGSQLIVVRRLEMLTLYAEKGVCGVNGQSSVSLVRFECSQSQLCDSIRCFFVPSNNVFQGVERGSGEGRRLAIQRSIKLRIFVASIHHLPTPSWTVWLVSMIVWVSSNSPLL